MNWIIELFSDHSSPAYIILVYAIVIFAGVMLGKLGYKGISFGIACVLFTGIIMGNFGFGINEHVLEYIKDFGLILFVYTMGLQVGPGFFASLRKQGLTLNMLAILCVLLSVGVVISIFYLTGIPISSLVGLMSGAVTNTPGLGAAQQTVNDLALANPGLNNLPSAGSYYAIAYPGGVIGIILVIILLRWVFKINLEKEKNAYQEKTRSNSPVPGNITLAVENPALIGKSVKTIFDTIQTKFVVSRVMHNNVISPGTKESILHENDIVKIVANKNDLERLKTVIGKEVNIDLDSTDVTLVAKKINVTRKEVCTHSLSELDVINHHSVTITRILRAGIEFIPNGHTRLQFGDIVTVIGYENNVEEVAKEFGNSKKQLSEPNIAGLFIGIAIGVIFGSIPFAFPGIPVPVKLGLAGGPLVAAILISRFGNIFPVTSYVTASANYMVREIGIVLFLASVGLKAGPAFVQTIFSAQGLHLVLLGLCITVIPLIITSLVARYFCKLNFLEIFGLLAGSLTDPPALSFATRMAGSDAPAIVYASIYPLTMFLRILVAQIIILMFV